MVVKFFEYILRRKLWEYIANEFYSSSGAKIKTLPDSKRFYKAIVKNRLM